MRMIVTSVRRMVVRVMPAVVHSAVHHAANFTNFVMFRMGHLMVFVHVNLRSHFQHTLEPQSSTSGGYSENMKITKHGHACIELQKDGSTLVLDPGFYTEPMDGARNVVAVVLTHMHDDHCYEEQLDRLTKNNPELQIFGTDEVCKRLQGRKVTAVHHGDFYNVGPFTIEFFGDLHAEIHRSIPIIQNCGVMINDTLYYPGDSFTRPDRKVKVLACPTSAPWLKISDVIDFVDEIKPEHSFATHNALLSDFGHALNNLRVAQTTEKHGGKFTYLQVGDSIEV